MKNVKSLLLLTAGFMCIASPVNAQQVSNEFKADALQFTKEVKAPAMTMLKKDQAFRIPIMAPSEDIMKLPQKITDYFWDGSEWNVYGETFIKFDDYGYQLSNKYLNYDMGVLTQSYDWTYKRDDLGRVIEQSVQTKMDENSDWVNFRRQTCLFDDIVKDFIILNTDYIWDEDLQEWVNSGVDNGGYYEEITRDENNKVVSKQGWFDQTKEVAYLGQMFIYDEEGNASEMLYFAQDENTKQPKPVFYYNNIVWDKTDYQYVRMGANIYRPFDNDRNNQVSYYNVYRITGQTENGLSANWEASCVKTHSDDTSVTTIQFQDYNSTSMTISNVENKEEKDYYFDWQDANANGVYDDGELYNPEIAGMEYLKFDEYNNCTNDAIYNYNTETQQLELEQQGVKEIVYDEYGNMLEYTISFYDGEGNMFQKKKREYSDFINITTGIEDMSEEKALKLYDGYVSAPNGTQYTICDLSGRTVKSGIVEGNRIVLNGMPEGMYIVRAGSSAVKVMVK